MLSSSLVFSTEITDNLNTVYCGKNIDRSLTTIISEWVLIIPYYNALSYIIADCLQVFAWLTFSDTLNSNDAKIWSRILDDTILMAKSVNLVG